MPGCRFEPGDGHTNHSRKDFSMLRAIVAIFLILWLLGFVLHIAGNLVHLLVLVALVLLFNDYLVRGRAKA